MENDLKERKNSVNEKQPHDELRHHEASAPLYSSKRTPQSVASAHVAENDNTRVASASQGVSENREGSSFIDGVKTALQESEQALRYIGKEAQKMFTSDPKKLEQIEAEQDSIVAENSRLPRTRDWGTAGSVATNIATTALPTVIAGLLGGPAVAGAVGAGVIAFDAAKTGAQANLEMDFYEKSTGKKIDSGRRAAYTTASIATDAIMNMMMGSKMLSGMAPAAKKTLSNELKKAIMENPVAQAEFNTMTRNVIRQESRKWAGQMAQDVSSSAIEGGVASGALEAERSIYTEQAPELDKIIDSVLSGTAVGAMQGGAATAGKRGNLHLQRSVQDDTFYGSNTTNKVGQERQPIAEFRPTHLLKDTDGNIVAAEGRVATPEGSMGNKVTLPIENISVGSYKEAHKSGATTDMRDNWDFTEEQMSRYQSQWDNAMKIKEKNPEKAYLEQNRVVQSIAAEMGVPINVYAQIKDLPPELRNHPEVKRSYAVTVNDNTINVVLDRCEGLSASNIASIIRHEAVGHYGMNKTYKTQTDYENVLNNAGKDLIPQEQQSMIPTQHSKGYAAWLQRIEERASRKAETREYMNDTDGMYRAMYDMLRRSEGNIRSTTVNELKKKQERRGRPMPALYEMER